MISWLHAAQSAWNSIQAQPISCRVEENLRNVCYQICGEVLYCRQRHYGSWHCAPTKPQSRYAQNQIEKRGPDTFTGLSGPVKEAEIVSWEVVLKILLRTSNFIRLSLVTDYIFCHPSSDKRC
jgi:hypothetical protein